MNKLIQERKKGGIYRKLEFKPFISMQQKTSGFYSEENC